MYSWSALAGVLVVGIGAGGPPVMIYSWIAVCALTFTVAYSLAEMCSAYPVSGGQYSWVALLAPPPIARGLSWVTGWFMITGLVAMGSTTNFFFANFVLGMANLANPEYVIERWHTVLVSYLIAIMAALINIFLPRLLSKISTLALCWNLLSLFVIVVTILSTNNQKQSSSFVWKDFQNFTGFGSGMATVVGLLQSFYGMCCYDAPAHMTEEMKNASKEAPRAIILSVWIGAVTGFVFLVSAFYCIGNIEQTAMSPTGVPLIQIFFDSTGSVQGSLVLTFMITVVVFFSANALMADGSRSLFAFARDHGLPFSKFFAKVDRRRQVPNYSILLCAGVQMALQSIYFGSLTGFLTVVAISTEGFYVSYALPLFARLLARYTGHAKVLSGPYSMGKYGIWVNLIGFLFLIFAAITFNFPSISPVETGNMNYTSAAIGAIGLISLLTWIFDGRKNFTGPQTGIFPASLADDLGADQVHDFSRKLDNDSFSMNDGAGGKMAEKVM
jgi:choline transport protein